MRRVVVLASAMTGCWPMLPGSWEDWTGDTDVDTETDTTSLEVVDIARIQQGDVAVGPVRSPPARRRWAGSISPQETSSLRRRPHHHVPVVTDAVILGGGAPPAWLYGAPPEGVSGGSTLGLSNARAETLRIEGCNGVIGAVPACGPTPTGVSW